MPTIKRILAGRKAKASGDLFENALSIAANRAGFKVFKIPMGAKQVGPHKMIRVQTPFDFVLVHSQGCVFIDAKSTQKKSFSYTDCTPHQLRELMDAEQKGQLAGYAVYFSTMGKIIFFHAHKLVRLKSKESLKPEDGMDLGTMANFTLINVLEYWKKRDQEPNLKQTKTIDSGLCLETTLDDTQE